MITYDVMRIILLLLHITTEIELAAFRIFQQWRYYSQHIILV